MTDKEKLDKMKKLANAMYYAAQYLTTDASGLRKAMDEYHKFIIYEYNKQEPSSEDLEQAAEQAEQREGNLINGRFKAGFKSGAQWEKERDFNDFARLKKSWYEEGRIDGKFEGLSDDEKYQQGFHDCKEQMMKDAVKGQVERGYCEDGISEHFEVFAYLSGRDERFKDLSDGQSVKVIIIKE